MKSRYSNRRRPRGGFTLLEVLLVLAILGVIFAMVVPNLLGRQKKANRDTTKTSIGNLENTLKMYAIDHGGQYPQGSQDALQQLLAPVDAQGRPLEPYLDKIPKDAWGNALFYEYPNSKVPNALKPAIWSAGENGQNEDGSGDDVTNWEDLDI